MEMDERKMKILQAIIDDYILTGVPVGSRTISRKYDMGLSSATIRNEMSDLEELGYLDQPHVSAGRIPSAKAYRLYVDSLMKTGRIRDDSLESVSRHFSGRVHQMEDVIDHAASVISTLTRYTAVVLPPKGKQPRLQTVQLVPVSRALTEQLQGHTLAEACEILPEMITRMQENEELLQGLYGFLRERQEKPHRPHVAIGGTSNMLNYPEYNDVEKARSFLSLMETRDKLASIIDGNGEMAFTVRIGPETGVPEMVDCSIVTASYSTRSGQQGTIGVIGPTRMQYSRVMSILSTMGHQLTELFSGGDESNE